MQRSKNGFRLKPRKISSDEFHVSSGYTPPRRVPKLRHDVPKFPILEDPPNVRRDGYLFADLNGRIRSDDNLMSLNDFLEDIPEPSGPVKFDVSIAPDRQRKLLIPKAVRLKSFEDFYLSEHFDDLNLSEKNEISQNSAFFPILK